MSDDIPVIEMVVPMLGFPDRLRFTLVRLDEAETLFALQSVEDPALRFLVVPPQVFFPEYAPEVDDSVVEALQIYSADDVVTFLVVNPGEGLGTATANLLAPILVNHVAKVAGQVVLDADLPVRAPLIAS